MIPLIKQSTFHVTSQFGRKEGLEVGFSWLLGPKLLSSLISLLHFNWFKESEPNLEARDGALYSFLCKYANMYICNMHILFFI